MQEEPNTLMYDCTNTLENDAPIFGENQNRRIVFLITNSPSSPYLVRETPSWGIIFLKSNKSYTSLILCKSLSICSILSTTSLT